MQGEGLEKAERAERTDLMFKVQEALLTIEGRDPDHSAPRDWARVGPIAKELVTDFSVTSTDEIYRRAEQYMLCRTWDLTASSLVKWWTAIPSWRPRVQVTHGLASMLLMDAQRERERADGTVRGADDRGAPVRSLPGERRGDGAGLRQSPDGSRPRPDRGRG